jgi:hypothetical protein
VSEGAFEKLGAFYLGRPFDPASGVAKPSPLLYDAKDLTTHGLIVGMTGSGKTGLAIVLLEEAALDGVPSIVIDPKGDMANLALRFPELRPSDFQPWIDPAEATAKGKSVDDLARETAARWESGLAEWGQSKERIRALAAAADVELYTPGSASGRPIAALGSFDAPPKAVLADDDALRERVANAVSGLLGLVGIEADPVTSREHVLLASLLERCWSRSEDSSLPKLIQSIQNPPFARLGVLDLESFYPAKERFDLTLKLNGLLASPAFAAWREGEPLDVKRLLHSPEGKPRIAILSIAHLPDEARMFFVTLLLNEVIAWMRSQDGTGSLRALLYMDEIFGYFPPVKAPPSKAPMLTLLKQARAFGLGVVLSTQNPVDLDYKGLANIGTWFLGRLQTERDRERLLEGLKSVSGGADRAELEAILSSLEKRVFLMQNVHEDRPVVLQTRFAMSYLRGPLTLEQVKKLTSREEIPHAPAKGVEISAPRAGTSRPVLPPSIPERFLPGTGEVYRPAILATAQLHFVGRKEGVDHWETAHWLTPLEESARPDWSGGAAIPAPAVLEAEPTAGVEFAALPPEAAREKSFANWPKSLEAFLYRERRLRLFQCESLGLVSHPGESEADFRVRLAHRLRERRDEELEKIRVQYSRELLKVEEGVRRAEARLERESSQYSSKKLSTAIDFGMTLAGALFGRKLGSVANVGRASKTARSASRAVEERDDVVRATEALEAEKAKLAKLEEELAERTRVLGETVSAADLDVESIELAPRKADIRFERFVLAWTRD